uniref:ribosomal protein S10 n=1 Tax=Hypnea edeniana TaxID=1524265 RepID=UPI0023F24AE9|nr:ribosomal protein S10 [Hypnea edeniana]WCH54796.1 ribosomal protein S10 [Hypnea edeniana]WDY85043.1 ribosomal protein S10 [Hypnea edeniana]
MKITQDNKIRIKLRSYTHDLLTESCKTIISTAKTTNAKFRGAIALPTKRKIYCVLRSPHVDKDSREHFEIKSHSRIIDIYEPSSQTIDSLMKLNIPAGVDIEIKL